MLGVPYMDLYMVVIAAVLWFVLEQTPLGRRMFAVGATGRRRGWRAYTADIGQGYLFPALAAVFFGASQLSQRPNVWGTLIAFFALAFGIQGLTLQFGAGTFWASPLFQGVALIGAVSIASTRGAIGTGGDGRAIRRLLRSHAPAAPDSGAGPQA